MQWLAVCALVLAGLASIDATCKDLRDDCMEWLWVCNQPEVQKNCAATCGYCPGIPKSTLPPFVGDCKDTRDDCMDFKMMCPQDLDFRKECPVTCKLCTPSGKPTPKPFPPHAGGCGQPDVAMITGKTPAPGSWPWHASVYFGGLPTNAATVLAPKWVLTSITGLGAGAMFPQMLRVSLGNFNTKEPTEYTQDISLDKIILHPEFDKNTKENDIALIKLEKPITFNRYISPVCLPSSKSIPAVGSKCIVTSYGLKWRWTTPNDIPYQKEYTLVSNEDCAKKNKAPIADSQFCVEGNGQIEQWGETWGCQVDNGAPFVCKVGDKWELQGAFSHDGSKECSASDSDAVFSRITSFESWIQTTMNEH